MSRHVVPALGIFGLVTALGFDDGGYTATAWGWSSVVLLVGLALVIARGVGRPRGAALVHVGALAGLTGWSAASILWSSHATASVLEVQRLLLYVAAAALFVLVGSVPALQAGVLGAVTALCSYGLGRWLFGEPAPVFSADPQAGERLSEPIGYANAVGIFAAMGLLLSAGFAARAVRTRFAGAAAAAVPMLAACLYFTFSRGAWLALAVGLLAAVAAGPARLQLAATALALAVPAAAAVVTADALGDSTATAAVLLAVCAGAALVPPALRARSVPSQRVRAAFAVMLIAVPLAVLAGVLVETGGPAGALDSFKAAPAPAPTHGNTSGRVFDLSGRNRADYWSVAWQSYEQEPALGSGAGSYARTWLRERPVPQPVTDAHSLYLETLTELGPLGLALLVVALAAPLAARRTPWTALALGPYAAFLAHAAQDWDWELPAVSLAALACGVAPICGQTTARLPRVVALVPAALCVLVSLAFAGNRALQDAIDATDRLAWSQAADDARRARRLQPWSPEPWRLLGELELAEGSLVVARRHFRKGLRKDPDEFELWIGLGLASEGAARRRAFERAARLNPLSPELRELGFKTD